jgi:hypothetical protein
VVKNDTPEMVGIGNLKMTFYRFLRLHKIEYIVDTTKPFGAKGKAPWITFNGKNVDDSQVAAELLAKELSLDLNPGLDDSSLGISRAFKLMLEQDLVLCLVSDRFVFHKPQVHQYIFNADIANYCYSPNAPLRCAFS